MTPDAVPVSRLRRLARPAPAAGERCDLCAEPLPEAHRHLLDLERRELRCACRACALLFDRRAAGGGHYRLLPERYVALPELAVDDAAWERFAIPVATAFLFHSTAAGRVVACYPSPGGATESLLAVDAWETLVAASPALAGMEPDVEALLVHRARGAREAWLVPVDACYRLVGVIRAHWKGFSGGAQVWAEVTRFFDDLREKETRCRSRTT